MSSRARLLQALSLGLASLVVVHPTNSEAQVFIGVNIRVGPPPLPVYVQPEMPGPNFLWVPGYWGWDNLWGDYFWVPGTWVQAPRPGLLWTPGYWGWNNGIYVWNGGYWGRHIGWYGGVNYGFGYTPTGFFGGYWNGNNFYYNRAVTNVGGGRVTNIYNKTVINNYGSRNVAYSGGPGGVNLQPTPEQRRAMHEPHVQPTRAQIAHVQAAQVNRGSYASVNKGRPAEAAVSRPHPAPTPAQMAASRPGRAALRPANGATAARSAHAPSPAHIGVQTAERHSSPPPGHVTYAHRMITQSAPTNHAEAGHPFAGRGGESHVERAPVHENAAMHAAPFGAPHPGGGMARPQAPHPQPAQHEQPHPGGGRPEGRPRER